MFFLKSARRFFLLVNPSLSQYTKQPFLKVLSNVLDYSVGTVQEVEEGIFGEDAALEVRGQEDGELLMRWKTYRLIVGYQKSTMEYVQYYVGNI